MSLKTGLRVVQGHWQWCRLIYHIQLLLVHHCKYSCILYCFWVIWRWIILNNNNLEIWVRGHSRSFKLVPFESLDEISYSPFVVSMALSCVIVETKWDIGRKSWFFSYHLAFYAPVRCYPSEYCHSVWCGKTRMVWLPDGEKKTLMICLAVRQNTGVWKTDGQTSCHSIVRAMHTRRAVKKIKNVYIICT